MEKFHYKSLSGFSDQVEIIRNIHRVAQALLSLKTILVCPFVLKASQATAESIAHFHHVFLFYLDWT